MKFSFLFLYIFSFFEWYNVVPRRGVWWQPGRTAAPRPLLAHRNTLCSPHMFFLIHDGCFFTNCEYCDSKISLFLQQQKNYILYLIFLFSPFDALQRCILQSFGKFVILPLRWVDVIFLEITTSVLVWFIHSNLIKIKIIHFFVSTTILLRVSQYLFVFQTWIVWIFRSLEITESESPFFIFTPFPGDWFDLFRHIKYRIRIIWFPLALFIAASVVAIQTPEPLRRSLWCCNNQPYEERESDALEGWFAVGPPQTLPTVVCAFKELKPTADIFVVSEPVFFG